MHTFFCIRVFLVNFDFLSRIKLLIALHYFTSLLQKRRGLYLACRKLNRVLRSSQADFCAQESDSHESMADSPFMQVDSLMHL
jgi:hypothetical protein